MRNDLDTNHFKAKLEEELALVEGELKSLGHKSAKGNLDWEANPTDMEDSADENETADKFEEEEETAGVIKQLEVRFNDLKVALAKIAGGSYGVCEVGGEPIEQDRLEANPSARTCKTHMK